MPVIPYIRISDFMYINLKINITIYNRSESYLCIESALFPALN